MTLQTFSNNDWISMMYQPLKFFVRTKIHESKGLNSNHNPRTTHSLTNHKCNQIVEINDGFAEIDCTTPMSGHEKQKILFRLLDKRYNMQELNILAFNLDIELEDLEGDTAVEKAMELVLHCSRREKLDVLVEEMRDRQDLLDELKNL